MVGDEGLSVVWRVPGLEGEVGRQEEGKEREGIDKTGGWRRTNAGRKEGEGCMRWKDGGNEEWRKQEGGREKEGIWSFFLKYRAINLGSRVSINLVASGENMVYAMNGRRGRKSLRGDKLRQTEQRC